MDEKTWRPGAVVVAGEATPPKTGGWRSGKKPAVDLGRCVNCLLCYVYCPDMAIRVEGRVFAGIDHRLCKGCELCTRVCPVGAVVMVDEETPVGPLGELGGDAHDNFA